MDGTLGGVIAYVQPLGDAIGIMCTLLVANAFAVAMLLDVRGWATKYAEATARSYERPAGRFLVLPRQRALMTDPEYLKRTNRVVAALTLCVFGPVLMLEVVLLIANGVR